MKRALSVLFIGLFFTISGNISHVGADPVTRSVGEAPYRNSDCLEPLIVRFQRCTEECASNRDCQRGWVCTKELGHGICKPPPPAPGGFTGRVERALGKGVGCSIAISPISGGSGGGSISCNAVSGGFMKEELQPGIYLLRITAGVGTTQGTRDFYAPVNAGSITDLGALTVLIHDPSATRPGMPGSDLLHQPATDPSRPTRINPNIGQPPIR